MYNKEQQKYQVLFKQLFIVITHYSLRPRTIFSCCLYK